MVSQLVLDEVFGIVHRAMADSPHQGANCIPHAVMTARLLRARGINAEVVAGTAGWQLGYKDGVESVCHSPEGNGQYDQLYDATWDYHAWVEIDGFILDTTMYQMPIKLDHLSGQDGITINKPYNFGNYLYTSKRGSRRVGGKGAFFYERNEQATAFANLYAMVKEAA